MSYTALLAVFLLAQAAQSEGDLKAEVARLRVQLDTTTYQHRLEVARHEWLDGNITRAQGLLEECPESLRGFEWRFLDQLVRGSRVTGVGAGDIGLGIGFRSGDEEVDLVSARGDIFAWGVGPGQERLFAVPARHLPGPVANPRRAARSFDGNYAALADEGDQVSVVDLRTMQVALKVTAPATPVTELCFSRDGRRLAILALDTVRVWEVAANAEVFALSLRSRLGAAVCLDLGPVGNSLAIGYSDGIINVWDVGTGSLDRRLSVPGTPTRMLFHPEGTRLAVLASDRLRLCDLATPKFESVEPAGNPTGVTSIAWSPDGTRLAAGSGVVVLVWDATGKLIETHRGHAGRVRHVAFSTDARRLASLSDDRVLKVWDVPGQPAGTLFAAHPARITGVAWSPDGTRLATASADRTVKVWEATTRRNVLALGTHPNVVTCLAYAPDGKQIATGCADGVVRTWDARTGHPVENLGGFRTAITSVAYSPDGKYLAAVAEEGLLQVQTRADSKVRAVKLPGPGAFGLAFRPDGSRLAIGCSDLSDVAVRIFEPGTLREVQTLTGPRALPAVAWSPDGSTLAFASSTGTRLLHLGGSPEEVLLRDTAGTFDEATALTFSPDGKRIATTGIGRPVRVWDTTTGLELLASPEDISGAVVTFSPDGARLALGEQTGLVRIFEAPVRAYPRTFTDSSYQLAFAPDGRGMVTGVRQPAHLLQLWDLRTGRKGAVIDTLGGGLLSQQVYFSPDSSVVRTLQEQRVDGKSRFYVRFWDAVKGHETGRNVIEPPGTVVHWHWIGTHLAVATTTGNGRLEVGIWDALSGKLIRTLREVGTGVEWLRLSPDGTQVAISESPGSGRGTITTLWDVGSAGKNVASLESGLGTGIRLARLVFQPGGRTLAGYATGADGTTSLVVWEPRMGQVAHRIAVDRVGGALAFSPDGAYLAYLDGGILGISPTGKGPVTSMVAAPHLPFAGAQLAFTLDGKSLAVQGNRIYLWDFKPGASAGRDTDRNREIILAAVSHRAAAETALRERNWDAACFHLDRLIARQPEQTDLYRLRGRAFVGLGEYGRAVPDLARALQGNGPGVGRGLRAEEWKALEPPVTGALLKTPENWPLLALQGHVHAGQGQWVKAVLRFARAVKAGGNQPVVVERYAFAALGARDDLLYRKIAARMLADFGDPKDATTANNIAWACLVGRGVKPDKALTLARRAVEAAALAPGETRHAYLNTLALGLYRAGNLEEAERMVKAGIEANEDRASRLDNLLLALIHGPMGRKEMARIELAEALHGIEDDPSLQGSWEARLELAELGAEAEAILGK